MTSVTHQLQLYWPPSRNWIEVDSGLLTYVRQVQAAGTRCTGRTRIVKITTTTEVIE